MSRLAGTSTDPKAMWAAADQTRRDRMRVFNEIMTGPNPMTPEECQLMADKYPDKYGFMSAFGPKKVTP